MLKNRLGLREAKSQKRETTLEQHSFHLENRIYFFAQSKKGIGGTHKRQTTHR